MAQLASDVGTNYNPGTLANLGQGGYGFSASDIQSLQNAGISFNDLASLGLTTRPETTTSTGPTYSGAQGAQQSTQTTDYGQQQLRSAALLQAMLAPGQEQPEPGPEGEGKDET